MFPMSLVRRRRDRVSLECGDLSNVSMNLSEDNLTRILRPLQCSSLNDSLVDSVVSVLEFASKTDTALETEIANIISNNIVPGIKNLPYFEQCVEPIQKNMDPANADKISETVNNMKICDRILLNNSALMKRYNITRFVMEHASNVSDCIYEMCELIDTYNIPKHAKYNIALENVLYAMNTIANVNPETVLESVTGYFLSTTNPITDYEYNKLVGVLEKSKVYDKETIDSVPITKAMIRNKNANINKKKLSLLSCKATTEEVSNAILAVGEITSKADAQKAIKDICDLSKDANVTDKQVLKGAAQIIPFVYPVGDGFIDQMWARYTCVCGITTDGISPTIIADADINPEFDIKTASTAELAAHSFCESVTDNADMKKLLADFKAEQVKTVPMLRRLMSKLYSKDPKDVIDELPNLFSIIRVAFVSSLLIIPTIGPVLAIVAVLINWFVKKSISEKDATKLLNCLKKEKENVEKKVNSSSDKEKKRYEEYLSELEKSIKKVNAYLEDIDGEDRDSSFDDIDFGDMSLDEQVTILTDTVIMANRIAMQEFHLLPTLSYNKALTMVRENGGIDNYELNASANESLTKDSCTAIAKYLVEADIESFRDYMKIMYQSSFEETAQNILEDLYYDNYHSNGIIATEASVLYQKLESSKPATASMASIATTNLYNEALNAISRRAYDSRTQAIQEGFKLNDVKLVLQDAKRKAKTLNTKLQSLSQQANASASGIINSIEKSMTSDRREAIIKGRLLPSFTSMVKYAIAMAGAGYAFGPIGAVITAVGIFAVNKALTYREKQMILDEIETELKVVEKQISIAENDQDMKQYRTLLNVQKKLVRERQRIKYNMKAVGKNLPVASVTPNGSRD